MMFDSEEIAAIAATEMKILVFHVIPHPHYVDYPRSRLRAEPTGWSFTTASRRLAVSCWPLTVIRPS